MIYKPSKKLTFVVYENQRPAKCFEIKKNTVRFLIFFVPIIFLFSTVALFFAFSYIKNVSKEAVAVQEKAQVIKTTLKNESLQEKSELLKEKEELEQLNTELINKINSKGAGLSAQVYVPLFNPSQGAQDLTKDQLASIEDQKFAVSGGKAQLSFNIVNKRKDGTKLNGHVAVIYKSGAITSVYPYPTENKGQDKPLYLDFNMGESFSTSRFRPVEAIFEIPTKLTAPSFFEVVIFSKSGDLILRQVLGPISDSPRG